MLVDDPGDAGNVWMIRHAFVHQRRRAVDQRTIDQVAVPGDPADIGRAPIDLPGAVVEHPLMGQCGIEQIAAAGMQNALRLARGAGGIKDEQRLLGPHFLWCADLTGHAHQVVVADVAMRVPANVRTRAAHDDDLLHTAGLGIGQRLVDIILERHGFAAANAFVGGDHDLRLTIDDAPGQRFRGEATEHHRVDRADARTGQHRHRGLGNHRHVDGHHVAAMHILAAQRIGELADFLVQLAVGDLAVFGRIIALPDDCQLIAALGQVPIQAVGRDVERAIGEPFDVHMVIVEGGALDLCERPDPVQPRRLFTPEALGIDHRLLVHGLVAGFVGQ